MVTHMKKFVALLLTLLMALSLTPSFAAEQEEILFLTQAAWVNYFDPIIARYEELTGVKVIQEAYSFNDLLNVIEVKIGTGSKEYDVISVDVPMVYSYGNRDLLWDMSGCFTEEELATMLPAAIEASTYEGKLLAAPICNSSQLLWYNDKLLREAGIDMAELESYTTDNRITYERVVEICREALAVLDPDHTKGIYGLDFQQVDRVYQMNMVANSMGGAQIDETGYSLDGVLNTQEWIDALTWYQGIVEEGIATRGITASELPNYFYSDKLLFMIGVTDVEKSAQRNNMTWYGYTAAPAFAGKEDMVKTSTGSWHYGVSALSEKKEAAADFVKFITCGEGAVMMYEQQNMLPAYIPLLEELKASEDTPGFIKIAIEESMTTALPRALTPAFNEYSAVLNAVWSDTRNGEDVEETIEWAIEEYAAQTVKYAK